MLNFSFISFITEIIIGSLKGFDKLSLFFGVKIHVLFTNILTILFIPSTSILIDLMHGEYKNNWNIIIGFIIFALLFPLFITTIYVFGDENDKYRKDNFIYFEYVDIGKQIIYAFVSAYDIPLACLAVELAWILLFLAIRPFKSPSEYVLQGGSSTIVIIGNIIALVCEYKKTGFLSFKSSLALVISACIPAIAAIYVYFIFEFEIISAWMKEKENCDKEDEAEYFSFILTLLCLLLCYFME